MSNPTVENYDEADGWSGGIEQCPHCETPHHKITTQVVTPDGSRYESILDADVNGGPYFCAPCFIKLQYNQREKENRNIGEWSE